MILADMRNKGCERTIAVTRRVLDLRADLADSFAFPGHFVWREMPDGIPRHRAEVGRLMADGTAHRREAKAIGASEDRRLMRPRRIPLVRAIAGRMAIQASRTGQHLSELGEVSG
jgi:hypothetical protein